MTGNDTQRGVSNKPLWEIVAEAPTITTRQAAAALTAMELGRSGDTSTHRPAADRISQLGIASDRPDLTMRAMLILTDMDARSQAPTVPAALFIRGILAQAHDLEHNYVIARCHFLLAWISQTLGDVTAARRHAADSIEYLPPESPPGIVIDYLFMRAHISGPGEDADRYWLEALQIATSAHDGFNTVRIHNSIAYAACQVGDSTTAAYHSDMLLAAADAYQIPLLAVWQETVALTRIMQQRYQEAVDLLQPIADDMPTALRAFHGGVTRSGPYEVPQCLITLAVAKRHLRRWDEAQQHLHTGVALADEHSLLALTARGHEELAALYADQGNFEKAYEHHVAFYDVTIAMRQEAQQARSSIAQAAQPAQNTVHESVRFRELAMRDALTGLYNRRFIAEHIRVLIQAAVTEKTPIAAAIVDADFFKRINDELSHAVGDRVLQQLAALLDDAVMEPEVVGRLGGEEFVILMPYTSAAAAAARCEEVRVVVADYDWSPLTGDIPVTVSIGVTTVVDGHTSFSALLSDADRNLYRAKAAGRNRVIADTTPGHTTLKYA